MVVITGTRNDYGMWSIPLQSPTFPNPKVPIRSSNVANGVIRLRQTNKEMAQYLSGCCLNPTPSTLIHVIQRNHFQSWPAMTTKLISKNLPKYIAKAKEHFDQEQKNVHSTKLLPSLLEDHTVPKQEPNNSKSREIICTVVDTSSLHKSYSDQTDKFPVNSSSNNQYIFIIYHFDTNSINAVLIKSRRTEDVTKSWKDIFNTLKLNGHAPKIHVLDNKYLSDLKAAFKGVYVQQQLPRSTVAMQMKGQSTPSRATLLLAYVHVIPNSLPSIGT